MANARFLINSRQRAKVNDNSGISTCTANTGNSKWRNRNLLHGVPYSPSFPGGISPGIHRQIPGIKDIPAVLRFLMAPFP